MGGKNQGLGSSNSRGQPNFWRRTRSTGIHTFKPHLLGLESHLSSNIYTHPYTHAVLLLQYLCFIISLLSGVSLQPKLVLASYLTNKAD